MKIITLSLCLSLCLGILTGLFYYEIIILVPRKKPVYIAHNNTNKNSTLNTLITKIQTIVGPKITCQSAIIDNSNILYLSFDTIPVSSEKSFHENIIEIQEILDAIYAINSTITAVYFLQNHMVISNYKIDFTVPILIKQPV